MQLVHSFDFPLLAYSSPSKQALALAKANKKPKPVRVTVADTDEEIEETPEAQLRSGKKSPYSSVQQNNGYWGCFDGREGTVVLFKTKFEAAVYLQEQLHGGWNFKAFYGNKAGQN